MTTEYNIQQKKLTIDIVETIRNSGVAITKHGKDYFGLCPFHTEKTASFSVSPQKQIFHCFGCGVGGDVIEFVQKHYSLDFLQALEFLKISDTKEQLPVKKMRRLAAKKYRSDRRKKHEQELLKAVQGWTLWYGAMLVNMVEIIERSLKKLTWEHIQELSELIHEMSVWKYHIWLIYTVKDESILYELYREKSK